MYSNAWIFCQSFNYKSVFMMIAQLFGKFNWLRISWGSWDLHTYFIYCLKAKMQVCYIHNMIQCALYVDYSLIVTIPSTSASVERRFSCLRRAKTSLRNTMSEERKTYKFVKHFNWKRRTKLINKFSIILTTNL